MDRISSFSLDGFSRIANTTLLSGSINVLQGLITFGSVFAVQRAVFYLLNRAKAESKLERVKLTIRCVSILTGAILGITVGVASKATLPGAAAVACIAMGILFYLTHKKSDDSVTQRAEESLKRRPGRRKAVSSKDPSVEYHFFLDDCKKKSNLKSIRSAVKHSKTGYHLLSTDDESVDYLFNLMAALIDKFEEYKNEKDESKATKASESLKELLNALNSRNPALKEDVMDIDEMKELVHFIAKSIFGDGHNIFESN